ncbi:helix-turn-helix domain-containing protein [Streptomyces sp. NPDC004069]
MTDTQPAVLEGWVRRRTTAPSLARRKRIVLKCAEGHSITAVSRRLRISSGTVGIWRQRFLERGLNGLTDEPRPGVLRKITDADVKRVIVKTLEEKPKNATHWSTRSMAAATGMPQSAISRVWRAFALAPHRSRTFKLSTDPLFIGKVLSVPHLLVRRTAIGTAGIGANCAAIRVAVYKEVRVAQRHGEVREGDFHSLRTDQQGHRQVHRHSSSLSES